MRRGRQVGLVAGAPRGVVADGARAQPRGELAGQVPGADVVGRDEQRGAAGEGSLVLDQGREEVRPDRGGDADGGTGLARGLSERLEALVLAGYVEKGAKAHRGALACVHAEQPDTRSGGPSALLGRTVQS